MNVYPFSIREVKCPETGVTLVYDLECDVAITAIVVDGELVTQCRDVMIGGVSLKGKSALSQLLCNYIMEAADEELDNAGALWDRVSEDQGIYVSGAGGPDAHFYQVA